MTKYYLFFILVFTSAVINAQIEQGTFRLGLAGEYGWKQTEVSLRLDSDDEIISEDLYTEKIVKISGGYHIVNNLELTIEASYRDLEYIPELIVLGIDSKYLVRRANGYSFGIGSSYKYPVSRRLYIPLGLSIAYINDFSEEHTLLDLQNDFIYSFRIGVEYRISKILGIELKTGYTSLPAPTYRSSLLGDIESLYLASIQANMYF